MFLTSLLCILAINAEPVELKTPTGTLHGILQLPDKPRPCPVVLIHAGSGPTDRDGNQANLKNDSLKQLGEALVEKGIAVLRIDKRGVGASKAAFKKEEDVRVSHFVDDVVAWTKFLQADKRFTAIGLIGHSEGSLMVSLAAQQVKVQAVVSLCGPGRTLGAILREQLKKNSPTQFEASDKIITQLEKGELVNDPPKVLAALFRPSVQPYLISLLKIDPAKELGQLQCPVLIVSGTSDIQIPVLDGEVLLKGQPKAKHVVLQNMAHVLKETELTASVLQQLAVYNNAKAPLHPKLVPAVSEFLAAAFSAQ